MSDYISPPTVGNLMTELTDIVEWYYLGVLLDIKYPELEKIKMECPRVNDCKLQMFAKWLENDKNTTWCCIVEALKSMNENKLANNISFKYYSVINDKSLPLTRQKSFNQVDLNVEKTVIKKMTIIESAFASLVVDTQIAVATDQCILSNVLTYLKARLSKDVSMKLPLSTLPNACELTFSELNCYWDCLKISPLNEIIVKFLRENVTLNSKLKSYISELDSFKSSTKMRELIDVIKKKRNEKGPTKPVILKLGRMWEEVTLRHFEYLIQMLFDEEEEELYGLEVIGGSIYAWWFINNDADTIHSLIIRAYSISTNTLRLCQVLHLQIGEVVIWHEASSNIPYINISLIKALAIKNTYVVEMLLTIELELVERNKLAIILTTASDLKDLFNNTILHVACYYGHFKTVHSLCEFYSKRGDVKIALNSPNSFGSTPLMLASRNGHSNAVKILLRYGAIYMVTAVDKSNLTLTNLLRSTQSLGLFSSVSLPHHSLHCSTNFIATLLRHFIKSLEINSGFCIAGRKWNVPEILEDSRSLIDALYTGNELTPLIHTACENNQLKLLLLLLSVGANPNAVANNTTPLLEAIRGGHADIVSHLLVNGSNPNLVGSATPLYLACSEGYVEIVDLLLKANADHSIVNSTSKVTPLMIACDKQHQQIVKRLLRQPRMNINAKDSNGKTALHYAIENPSKIASLLVTKGANPNIINKQGWAPLSIAIFSNHHKNITCLLQSPSIDLYIKSPHGTPLEIAIQRKNLDIIQVLLNTGVNPNVPNSQTGLTPIEYSCSRRCSKAILIALLCYDVDVITKQLTVLMVACYKGYPGVVEYILEHFIPPINEQSKTGMTALHFAVINNRPDIVKILLSRKANPNISTTTGECTPPLISACLNGNTLIIEQLLNANADVNGRNAFGSTAIYVASSLNSIPAVKLLLSHKADPNISMTEGWTPLMVASASGYLEIVMSLLKANADPNHQRVGGITALHLAVKSNQLEVVNLLLQCNADPTLTNDDNETALAIATKSNPPNEEMITILSDATNNYITKTHGSALLATPAISKKFFVSTISLSNISEIQSIASEETIATKKSAISEETVDSGISAGSKQTDTQSLSSAISSISADNLKKSKSSFDVKSEHELHTIQESSTNA